VSAETENIISEISNRINFATKEANQKIASIENEIITLREAAHAKGKLCTFVIYSRPTKQVD